MAQRKYIVQTGEAYGVKQGETVTLDASDDLVQINVQAGVITLAADTKKKG